jgi:hypothetical protein
MSIAFVPTFVLSLNLLLAALPYPRLLSASLHHFCLRSRGVLYLGDFSLCSLTYETELRLSYPVSELWVCFDHVTLTILI